MCPKAFDTHCNGLVGKGSENLLKQEAYNFVFMHQVLKNKKKSMSDGSRLPTFMKDLIDMIVEPKKADKVEKDEKEETDEKQELAAGA